MFAKKLVLCAILAWMGTSRFMYRNEHEFIRNRKTAPKRCEHVTYTVPLAQESYQRRKERDEKTVVALCSHSMTDSTDGQEAKNITAVDTEYEGIVAGVQNFTTQSFDGYTCGYEYLSTEIEEVQYLRGDPFGIKF